jgi:hypothetical protein
MRLFLFCLLLSSLDLYGQKQEAVYLDLVKVKNGKVDDALHFFKNGWKVYRDSALKAGLITGYRLLRVETDSSDVDIVLMTVYPDRETYNRREEIFQPIMKALRPNGPAMRNGFKREDLEFKGKLLTESLFPM